MRRGAYFYGTRLRDRVARWWRGHRLLPMHEFRARAHGWHRGVPGEWRQTLLRDPCVYCGAKPTGLDHIWPRSKGGKDGWHNRGPACRSCDFEKRSRVMIVFLLDRHTVGWRNRTWEKARSKPHHVLTAQRRVVKQFTRRAQPLASLGEVAQWRQTIRATGSTSRTA